jgi:hypothetical protein
VIISDLTYLETVSEVSTIVGGTSKCYKKGGSKKGGKGGSKGSNGPRNSNTQYNTINQSLEQNAKAGSLAVGSGASSGDATAVNVGFNIANISDNNQGILDLSE